MADPIMPWDKPHDEAEALLPWYATGQLDERDRARVEKHLSACTDCRHAVQRDKAFEPGSELRHSYRYEARGRRVVPELTIRI